MRNLERRIKYLRASKFFNEVSSELRTQVAEVIQEARFPAADIIFREGEFGDAVYLIVEGRVVILKEDVKVLYLEKGDWVGEMALLDDEPRSATIAADTDVLTLKLLRKDFDKVLGSYPEVRRALYRILVKKIRLDLDKQVKAIQAQEQVKQDIRRASEVQDAMLPSGTLTQEELRLTGTCIPAATVGGDYYEHVPLDNNRVALFLGDVTGHGFYCGLIVAMAKSCLLTQLDNDPSPDAVMTALNRIIYPFGPEWIFMTGCYILVNRETKTLSYLNAGQNHPLLYRQLTGELIRLNTTSYPIGVLPDIEHNVFEESWEPGDWLLMHSDGIVEAENEHRDQFGDDRLKSCLMAHINHSPVEVKKAIFNEVTEFMGEGPQKDDMTVVVVKL
jgi:sigma-B regulation protein RsbU (phosphoserine phosphatase)